MATWATSKNQQMFSLKGFDESELAMGVLLSQKPGNDLIQNCDLPPPTKVFSGLSDNITVISPMNRRKTHSFVHDHENDANEGDKNLGLLKALRLSQTRAREAEGKVAEIIKERDALAVAFVHDSMQIFAYKQFVRLLEAQVSQSQKQKDCCDCEKREQGKEEEEEFEDGNGNNGMTFFLTVAFCFGIAGVGIAIGCKYLYSYV